MKIDAEELQIKLTILWVGSVLGSLFGAAALINILLILLFLLCFVE